MMSVNSKVLQSCVEELVKEGASGAEEMLEPIVEVEAVNTTPLIPGGPDTYTVNERGEWEGIRPTALRGVWRWWVRTLLAGILWEKGVRDYDYQKLALIESKLLGLGAVEGKVDNTVIESEATRIVLSIDDVNIQEKPLRMEKFVVNQRFIRRKRGGEEPNVSAILKDYVRSARRTRYESEPWKILLSIPRYILIRTGKNVRQTTMELYRRQPIPPGKVRVRISLREFKRIGKPLSKTGIILGSAALILALAWGGVGQATTRGFGKFSKISILKDKLGVASKVLNVVGSVSRGDLREVVRGIISIVSESIPGRETSELLKHFKIHEKTEGSKRYTLPLTPTFHPDTIYIKIVSNPVVRVNGGRYQVFDVWSAIVAVGRACLKLEWKALASRKFRVSGKEFHTWPLGLPRYVERMKTGYAFKEDNAYVAGRLTSLIRFTPLDSSRENVKVLVYAFKTLDLERVCRELLHLSDGVENKVSELPALDPVTKRVLGRCSSTDYLSIAFNTVVNILSPGGGR